MVHRRRHVVVALVCLLPGVISSAAGLPARSGGSTSDREELEMLRALGYVEYMPDCSEQTVRGVTRHDPARVHDGYRFGGGRFIDVSGRYAPLTTAGWVVAIRENGEQFWLKKKERLVKRDAASRVVWQKELHVDHDIALTPAGTVLVQSKDVHLYNGRKVIFDVVVEFSDDGIEIGRWSTWEHFAELRRHHEPIALDSPATVHVYPNVVMPNVKTVLGADYDYYHLNSIQALPETPAGVADRRFQAGNWLLSFRHVDLIVILDKDSKRIVWTYGPGRILKQHMPRILDNGNMLIYDNGEDKVREFTRVIELNPVTTRIVWEYRGDPPGSFYSNLRGSAQRLPNGNTLITDSNCGRAFEVTSAGEVVWEFYNPKFDDEGNRKIIYRMIHFPRDLIENLVERSSQRTRRQDTAERD